MSHKQHDRGFTIVELLVVIVVIGILAAITIIAYNGITARAQTAGLQSDLEGVSKQLSIDYQTNGIYPTSLAAVNNNQGVKPSFGGSEFTYHYDNTEGPAAYCLTATKGTTSYFVTNGTTPVPGTCPQLIYEAAGNTAPIAVLGPGSNLPTNLTDAMLSGGVSFYFIAKNGCNATNPQFTIGTGPNINTFTCYNNGDLLNYSISGSSGQLTAATSSNPNGSQTYLNPAGSIAVSAFTQSSTGMAYRMPGQFQATNTAGRTFTGITTYSSGFDTVLVYAGVHSQATSDAIMGAIANDWNIGGGAKPYPTGIGPNSQASCDATFPIVFTTAIAYSNFPTTIQWQVAMDNGSGTAPFNDIPGATNPTYSTNNPYGASYVKYRAKLTNMFGITYTQFTYVYNGSCG